MKPKKKQPRKNKKKNPPDQIILPSGAMNIEPARPKHAEWLNETIKDEFPYTKFTPENILSRINDPNFLILIARQENIMTGFAEMQGFPEKNEARLNAIYVEEAWRDQGIAKALIARITAEAKRRKLVRIFLLVKETNEDAKALYERTGFKFEKMHDKKIEGTQVEVWAKKL